LISVAESKRSFTLKNLMKISLIELCLASYFCLPAL